MTRHPTRHTLFPYTTLFRSSRQGASDLLVRTGEREDSGQHVRVDGALVIVERAEEERKARAVLVSEVGRQRDRKSTRLNSSHGYISYAVFCLKKKKI